MAKTTHAFRPALLVLAAVAGLALAPTASAAEPGIFGTWRNPKNSVHVEIKDCGGRTCGYVVWANATAQADARKGGTENLVGLQLLRDFAPEKAGSWRGKVFVPDLNVTLTGTAEVLDATSLRAKGCLLGRVLCKSQVWKRIDGVAD